MHQGLPHIANQRQFNCSLDCGIAPAAHFGLVQHEGDAHFSTHEIVAAKKRLIFNDLGWSMVAKIRFHLSPPRIRPTQYQEVQETAALPMRPAFFLCADV
jgi:hypothetical protein